MRRGSRGIAPVPDEIALRLGRVGSATFFMRRGEQRGPFAIEVDQLLGNGPPFRGVGVQQRRRAPLVQDGDELPSQIESVLHGDVHALPGLRTVGVAGIAGDEHARQPRRDLLLRHVIELVGQPLADLINRPPGDLLRLELVRMENPLRLGDELFDRDIAACDPFADFELGELDIEADEIAAFPRDDENAALMGGLDQALAANVREIGDGQHIHHAPGVVGGIAVKLAPDRGAHDAARAVAADHVAGLDRLDLSLVRGIEPLERDGCSLRAMP